VQKACQSESPESDFSETWPLLLTLRAPELLPPPKSKIFQVVPSYKTRGQNLSPKAQGLPVIVLSPNKPDVVIDVLAPEIPPPKSKVGNGVLVFSDGETIRQKPVVIQVQR